MWRRVVWGSQQRNQLIQNRIDDCRTMGAECGRRWPILRPLFGIDLKQRGSRFCRDKEDAEKAAADIEQGRGFQGADCSRRREAYDEPMRSIQARLTRKRPHR